MSTSDLKPEDATEWKGRLDKMELSLQDVSNRMVSMSAQLSGDVQAGTKESLSQLLSALSTVKVIADFIRGDYEPAKVDKNKRTEVLNGSYAVFEAANLGAEALLNKISKTHVTFTDMEQTELFPCRGQLKLLEEQNTQLLQNVEATIQELGVKISVLEASICQQTDAVSSLSKKIVGVSVVKRGTDVMFNPLGLPTNPDIEFDLTDPLMLQKDIDALLEKIGTARTKLAEANAQLTELKKTSATLKDRQNDANAMIGKIDTLSSVLTKAITKCLGYEQAFGPYKEAASTMILQMKRIRNDIELARTMTYTKEEIASDLLTLLYDALIDATMGTSVVEIKDNIITNYGNTPATAGITELATKIDVRAKELSVSK